MDTEHHRINVRVTRLFSASPARVFDAWLDAKTAGQWLFATAAGQIVCAEIDARAGGWFYIVDRRKDEDVEHIGEYHEMVRPRRLVFTLLDDKYSLDFERVTVVLAPQGAGCELRLSHETKLESASQVRRDWVRMLDGLAAALDEKSRDRPRQEVAAATQ